MKQDDDRLDALLRSRAVPAPPEALAARIAAQAAAEGWNPAAAGGRRLRAPRWLADLLQALYMPRPAFAFAFALVLLLGLVLGLDMGSLQSGDDAVTGDWSSLFSSGEGWL